MQSQHHRCLRREGFSASVSPGGSIGSAERCLILLGSLQCSKSLNGFVALIVISYSKYWCSPWVIISKLLPFRLCQSEFETSLLRKRTKDNPGGHHCKSFGSWPTAVTYELYCDSFYVFATYSLSPTKTFSRALAGLIQYYTTTQRARAW